MNEIRKGSFEERGSDEGKWRKWRILSDGGITLIKEIGEWRK